MPCSITQFVANFLFSMEMRINEVDCEIPSFFGKSMFQGICDITA